MRTDLVLLPHSFRLTHARACSGFESRLKIKINDKINFKQCVQVSFWDSLACRVLFGSCQECMPVY